MFFSIDSVFLITIRAICSDDNESLLLYIRWDREISLRGKKYHVKRNRPCKNTATRQFFLFTENKLITRLYRCPLIYD